MKTALISLMFALALALVSGESDAAKRFGGGNNVGKQRATPTQKEAAPAQTPAQAAPASTAAAAAKPSFMSRWGGMLAGLGIGVLLASMFGAQMGPIIGMILMVLAVAAVAFLAYRMLAGRRAPATSPSTSPGSSPQFAGIGSRVDATSAPEARAMPAGSSAAAPAAARPSFEVEPFLRVAKTSFIRLQAANDAGDLDDIRDYTTPEMFAEISMQVKERGGATQRTEVVNLNAELADSAIEGDYEIASVRFYGLLRENDSSNPEPFDEIWHVRRDQRDRKGSWLIAGIQQTA